MQEDVYEYLRNYGFTKEEINSFESHNIKLYEVQYLDVLHNFNFLEKCSLNKDQIIHLIKKEQHYVIMQQLYPHLNIQYY